MTSSSTKTELRRVSRDTATEEILAIVAQDGGVVIEQMVSPENVAAFNRDVDPYVQKRGTGLEILGSGSGVGYGANTKRLTNMITRSKTFRENIITDPRWYEIGSAQLKDSSDEPWLTTAQVIEIGPGNPAQELHRDMVNYPAFFSMGKSGPEVLCNFMVAFTDFTEENGATRVIPGSHHWDDYSDMGRPEDTIPAEMNAGDAFFFSGKVVHGGGHNRTDGWRRGLSMPFNAGWLVPEEAWPALVPLDLARTLPRHVQQMIGYRTFHNTVQGGAVLWTSDYEELSDWFKFDA